MIYESVSLQRTMEVRQIIMSNKDINVENWQYENILSQRVVSMKDY